MRSIAKLLILLFTIISQNAFASYDPTQDLINAYCSDIGPLTRQALQQTESLRQIVESIKEDPACQDVYALSVGFSKSVKVILDDEFSGESSEAALKGKMNLLAEEIELERAKILRRATDKFIAANPGATDLDIANFQLSFSFPKSTVLEALESEYAAVKVEYLSRQVNGESFSSENRRRKRLNQLEALKGNLAGFFATLNNSLACTQNHMGLVGQVGSQVLGLTSSLYGGVAGAAVAAGSALLAGGTQLIQEIKHRSRISDIENTQLQYAIGCSFEGIARTYCQARDTETVINYTSDMQNPDISDCPECLNLSEGIDLLSKKIDSFNTWVIRITAGSDPSNQAQARERIHAFELRNKFDGVKERVKGLINEVATTISQLTGSETNREQQKKNLLISLMKDVSSRVSSNTNGGPYNDAFLNDKGCGPFVYFYSDGKDRNSANPPSGDPRGDQEDCQKFVDRVYPLIQTNPLEIQRIRELMERINREGEVYVALQIQRVSEENPDRVMAQFESRDATTDTSPKSFLRDALLYLDKLSEELDTFENRYLLSLIKRSRNQMIKALEIAHRDCSSIEGMSEDCELAKLQLTELSALLAPKQQVLSVENALRDIVKEDLNIKLRNGDISDDSLRFLLRISSEESTDFLIRHYLDIQNLQEDIDNAKDIVQSNLENFANIFARHYLTALKKLKEGVEDAPTNMARRRVLGQRCVQALLSPKSSKLHSLKWKRLYKLCKGSIYHSAFSRKVPHLSFDKLAKKSFEKRVCEVYDFKRKLRLFQVSGELKKGSKK